VKYCLRNKAVKAEVFSGYYVGVPQVISDLYKLIKRDADRISMYFCTSVKIPLHSPTHPPGHYKPEAEFYRKY
jgi:hypothetical protein